MSSYFFVKEVNNQTNMMPHSWIIIRYTHFSIQKFIYWFDSIIAVCMHLSSYLPHIMYLSVFMKLMSVCVLYLFWRCSKTVFLLFQSYVTFTHEFALARMNQEESNTQNVMIGNEGEKRKIFFLDLTTNKTRSTASNDWLKRDDDVKLHRGGACKGYYVIATGAELN